MEAVIHVYKDTLLLLECVNRSTSLSSSSSSGSQKSQPPNILLFIGGMYDNFRNPGYTDDLAALFPRDAPNQQWRVMHVQLSSAGRSFGLFDLDRDVKEMSAAITYIRESITQSSSTPIVIMGFSTGCQDVMHYLCSPGSRPRISGAIIQAPVSDREAILDEINTNPSAKAAYVNALSIARVTSAEKHRTTILPTNLTKHLIGPAPLTVSRFLSLVSPDSPAHPAMDDYFSSDLSDQRYLDTFGRIGHLDFLQPSKQDTPKSILILESGSDASVPSHIDKDRLVARWKSAIESAGRARMSPHSMIVPNAQHDISGDSIECRIARLVDMRRAVLRFLEDMVGHVGSEAQSSGAWKVWKNDKDAIEAEKGIDHVKL
ncbi:hypothetical protein LTR10_016283 [Elasticomyces elasticus]|uniref:AB hydrolase-1 domain-containing protein n=1 Tax=Exophiala sideris TaxID=1016849 RepID=A0ABR0JNR3_9EURO|nr:hypothetical protein LTR10_016283 [Elasticomyces elasticus]KAK5037883.1 hypothetical protein LTS07_001350 [Exophiala sideris]KAK5043866.1 hypothetical protein LTR13_000220 [Exophiala sideris]KAK5067365.1 hypothetical protein LTR69_001352 [Exophiala sideris]KAK5182698.1 hypothetical protein LTR44_005089 [Eurotiomycetes sp. CCFEE 6388]